MTSRFFDSFLDELQARLAIEDTLKHFIRAVDRQDWAAARATYHDDAIDAHGFFTGPADELLTVVERLHERQDHSVHFISNILIEFAAPDRALVESYILVFQRFGPDAEGVPPGSAGVRKFGTARYIDRFETRGGDWRVAHRTLVFGDLQSEALDKPVTFPPGFIVQRHGMDDVLYELRATAK
jgi:SnoaL-like domain